MQIEDIFNVIQSAAHMIIRLLNHDAFMPAMIVFFFLLLLDRLASKRKGRHLLNVAKSHWHLYRAKRMPASSSIDYLRSINHFVFEELVLTALKAKGHKIKRNKRYTGDFGVDGQCWINGDHYFIQAKRYSGYISATHVEDFEKLCRKKNVKGLFVHIGQTGKLAKQKCSDRIRIVGGKEFTRLVQSYKASIHQPI